MRKHAASLSVHRFPIVEPGNAACTGPQTLQAGVHYYKLETCHVIEFSHADFLVEFPYSLVPRLSSAPRPAGHWGEPAIPIKIVLHDLYSLS